MTEVDDAQRQERRKKAGDLLKMADKLFKGSDFEGAARLVDVAMETDPQNAYALAYQERVKYAIAQRDGQRLNASRPAKHGAPDGPSPEEIKKKVAQAQRNIAEERVRAEAGAPAPEVAVPPGPGTQQLQKELDEVVRERGTLQTQIDTLQATNRKLQAEIENQHGDLQKLQTQVAQSQNAIAVEREQWSTERDGSRAQLEEGVHARAVLQKQIQDLQEQLDRIHSASEEEREKWGAEHASVLDATRAEWEQRLDEERRRLETSENELRAQMQELETARNSLQDQIRDLRRQLELAQEVALQERQQWEAESLKESEGARTDWEQRMESMTSALRRQLEEATLQRDTAQDRVQELEATLAEAQGRFAGEQTLRETKETELQKQFAALMETHDTLAEQLQNLQQQHEQEESQALQDLRRTLEQESAQQFDTANKKFQEERQRMELEMQTRLAAESHRQEDLRRERDELLTQFDSHRATLETERRRLEEELQNRILTERKNAAEEMHERLEARFKQERDALQRSARAAVEAEMEERFGEERAALVREQQRFEDELRHLNDKRQVEAQEGEAARSQVEEFQTRLVEEQRVHEKRSQETLDAAQQRWKTDQERQVEEVRAKLTAEYEGKLEEERQIALELRNRDHSEALETRRDTEEQLRKEFEAALMNRLKEERERFQSEYEDRMEGERARLELELRSAFDAEAQRRSDEEDRITREDRKAREAKERERRKEEEARKYEDAVRQAIEEGRHKAHVKKIASHMEQANVLLKKTKFAQALDEVSRIFALDPSHEEALALQHAIRAAQAEHDRRQEEVHRLQEEQKRRLEEVQSRLKEQEQKDRALQKERAAMEETVAQRIARAADYRRLGALDRALTEVQAVLTMDPGNGEAQDMEISILTQLKGHKEVRAAVARRTEQGESWHSEEAQREDEEDVHRDHLREESAQVYRSMLKRAWMQGEPGRDTRAMLDVARASLGINENEHTILQSQVQLETYRDALEMALDASLIEIDDVDAIDGIRSKYGVDAQAHEAVMESLRRRTS